MDANSVLPKEATDETKWMSNDTCGLRFWIQI